LILDILFRHFASALPQLKRSFKLWLLLVHIC